MTAEDWNFRIQEVRRDLGMSRLSVSRWSDLDCDTLERYIVWLEGKAVKAERHNESG